MSHSSSTTKKIDLFYSHFLRTQTSTMFSHIMQFYGREVFFGKIGTLTCTNKYEFMTKIQTCNNVWVYNSLH